MAKMFCLHSSRSCILKSFNFPSFGFPVVKCKELSVFHSKWIHEVTSSVSLSKKLINDSKQKSEGLCTSTCSFLYHNENKLSNAASKISQASEDFSLESEEDELNRESPLVHYASRRVLFVLQDSFLKEVSIPCPKHETSLDNYVNEANLLKDSHRTFANFPEDKEEAVYLIEAGKKLKVVPDIGKLPVNFLPWRTQQIDLANLLKYYAGLAKSRLTGLVVLTAMAGYAVAPAAFDFNGFLFCLVGTALVSSSANSINQVFEVPYDSQMDRTKNRVLVRGLLTPLHAFIFGLTCAGLGISSLYFGVNGITATLGGLNLILYTSVYTPLKRVSIINTWVGAIVGAIPPIMGWTGCTGALDGGVWILGGILYAWQFPHFNALSWNLRHDYSRAGYRMMTVTNPGLCRRTALRYSASLLLLSTAAPIFDVTTWTFAADSLPLNLYFTFLAWKFHKDGDSKSSRKLFRFSLFHLPALLALMIISKKPKPNADSDQTTS